MTDETKKDCGGCEGGAGGEQIIKSVFCRRTGQQYEVPEHQRCPYCFGNKEDVAEGDYAQFCDFQPGEDPVNFGFPGNTSREQRG